MKRPLIIGLSLAFVAFTTAASITSTVAWFSSTRVLTTSAGTFQVRQTDGSMDCLLHAGVGTLVSADNKFVSIASDETDVYHALLDGSVDLNGNAYRKERDTDNYISFGTPDPTSDDWHVDSLFDDDDVETRLFVAVSWSITFQYTFHTERDDIGIYLDLGATTMTPAKTPDKPATDDREEKSQYGFRIAFVPETGSTTVLGNNGAAANTLKYVSGTSSTANYTSSNYVTHEDEYRRLADGEGNASTPERICTLEYPTEVGVSTASCEVTCIAWFEGEDPNVISGTQMDTMSVMLSFYARSDAA